MKKKILDLTRKENAHALYRVSWIFSQPNLMTLVLNTQMQPINDSYSTFNVDKSLNSSVSKMEENSILAKELLRNTADARKNILKALEVKIGIFRRSLLKFILRNWSFILEKRRWRALVGSIFHQIWNFWWIYKIKWRNRGGKSSQDARRRWGSVRKYF